MLKRPRAPSPSPTRPDPSSPQALDSSAHLPIHATKRRRTVAPTLDSDERRGNNCHTDDGEDDYEHEDGENEGEAEVGSNTHDKVYEHVNHVLYGLHTEQQSRSRAQSTYAQSPLQSLGPRSYPDNLSPASSPVKYAFATPYHETVESHEAEDGSERDRFGALGMDCAFSKGGTPVIQGDERLRVTQRYEDTNRLLGSLVLSRRRRSGTPPFDVE